MISFDNIPTGWRVPGAQVEISNVRAGQDLSLQPYRVLLIAQALADVAPGLYRGTSADQVISQCGDGSQLAGMATAYFAANQTTETWYYPLQDVEDAVAAVWTATITGPASGDGALVLDLAGDIVRVGVLAGDDTSTIAQATVDAVAAVTGAMFTAALAAGTGVTFTARNAGAAGNGMTLDLNPDADDALPAGVAVTISQTVQGVTNPDLSEVVAAMGDVQFNIITHPYTDAANLRILDQELESRWEPPRQIEGMAVSAVIESFDDLADLGDGQNSPNHIIVGTPAMPSAVWRVAGGTAGRLAFSASQDPARPFQTLTLPGLRGPKPAAQLTGTENNLLLHDGISTLATMTDRTVAIQRLITTYRTNALGAADASYLDPNTRLTLAAIRYDWRNYVLNKLLGGRYKVGKDGTKFGAGQPVMTPKGLEAEAVSRFKLWMDRGWVQDLETFKTNLHAEIDSADPTHLNLLMVPDLVVPLLMVGTRIEFVRG
ncbi:phage tail sheath subtilisin-like domain-containing protein [Jeongeupia naejangsanensis]|uniref:Phage tail sheath subtilisin-like domain-containing protein n=1 Tax=Jeongeupia naejangsanensis TaxID=613195 RepID=A0ABS2BGR1_9NEIS|nr:phage tail sheath subtilisin-like domain-containing protein [Jeongeupia naejangsanensis]MBM3114278.1 phage tail sheath subtilisin-like domain-containing protein [Jeongeupia naejangsanensis]